MNISQCVYKTIQTTFRCAKISLINQKSTSLIHSSIYNLHSSKNGGKRNGYTQHNVAGGINFVQFQEFAIIPEQMANTVDCVIGGWEGDVELDES